MAGWKLEVFKMGMYMAFPVCLFHWFNQPEYFEKWVTEQKRIMYPPAHLSHHNEIQDVINKMRQKDQEEYLKQLKQMEK